MHIDGEIDRQLLERAQALTGLPTHEAVIEEALRLLVTRYEQQQVRLLRGRLNWEGDLAEMRQDRP